MIRSLLAISISAVLGDDLNMRFYCKGICGGSASGKTTVARKIIEALNVQWVSLVSMDSFYKVTFID